MDEKHAVTLHRAGNKVWSSCSCGWRSEDWPRNKGDHPPSELIVVEIALHHREENHD